MTILDTFYMLFESDASKLDKGLADSEKKAKKLAEELGSVDKIAGKLGSSLMHSLSELGGAIVATFALKSMSDAMFEAADHADKLNESAQRLGLNIETVSAWGDAIKKNGGSAEGFIASIEGLNSQLQQMEVTGKSRAAPFLKELGIDLDLAANKGKSAMDFLPQIADAFAGMDKQKSVALGKRLGFDQATIMTLQAGRREVEAMIEKEKELGIVTQKQGEIADAFGDQMDDTRHAFRSVWLGVNEYVLPPLTWMMEKMQDAAVWMRKHSDFIVGLMIALGAAIAFYVLPPLFSMAAAAVVAFAPFILAGALIAAVAAAFALLYDDIMAFVDGGESMIGQVLEKWPVVGQIAGWVADAVKGMLEVFRWVFNVIADLIGLAVDGWLSLFQVIADTGVFRAAFGVIGGLVKALGAVFESFGVGVATVWKGIVEGIRVAIGWIGKAIELVGKVGSFISGGVQGVRADTGAALAQGKEQLAVASRSPMVSQTSNSISNSTRGSRSTSVQVGKVEVHTQATDASGISKAIGGTMQTQMRQAVSNYDDGVLA